MGNVMISFGIGGIGSIPLKQLTFGIGIGGPPLATVIKNMDRRKNAPTNPEHGETPTQEKKKN